MKNPPETIEEAFELLKDSCDKYLKAKDKQWRPNPTTLRIWRKEFAQTVGALAVMDKEVMEMYGMSEKAAESWNKYFESRGETHIQKDHNKVVEKTEKQVEEPVFEADEMDYVIK